MQAYVKKITAKLNGAQPPYSGPRAYDIIYSYKYCIEKSGVTNKPPISTATATRSAIASAA